MFRILKTFIKKRKFTRSGYNYKINGFAASDVNSKEAISNSAIRIMLPKYAEYFRKHPVEYNQFVI